MGIQWRLRLVSVEKYDEKFRKLRHTDTWQMMPTIEREGFEARWAAHKMLCANGEHDWTPTWLATDGIKPSFDVCFYCDLLRGHD